MAKIKTDRAEAAAYNGRDAKFIKAVTDGPAYNPLVDQVIVEIDGVDLYFFANEVALTEDEAKVGGIQKKDAAQAMKDQEALSKKQYDAKVESLAETKEPPPPLVEEPAEKGAKPAAKPE